MTAPMVIEGAMREEMVLGYVEQCLVATLTHKGVAVVDNFAAHGVSAIRQMIERAGATPRYLPKSSPDLNPVELSYRKFKAFVRGLAEWTVPALYRAIRW